MPDDMKPGRALDAAVAERVMEWAACGRGEDGEMLGAAPPTWDVWEVVPHYSTDWRAAGEVWAKVGTMQLEGPWWDPGENIAPFKCRVIDRPRDLCEPYSYGDTGPHAICLAALAACEGEGR